MAVPKRRTSRSNTRTRRARWKAQPPTLVPCGCPRKLRTLPHRACAHCGLYAGRPTRPE
ncbi:MULTISPECIES: 50S ribosomal protein L32 [Protofrankia]|uniref:Large ribosomal subunit protein bL32 n=1 Tax=Candidatus Protofrankia datiscae TaxID=2716812 RepID=F8B3P3_9ACTN|nr:MULTISPECIES: 50S ribosomal protein L32 [Protofrankia]AEH07884.1 50S ribosomal protein L32 [Candidatus Protofrankia datiscae]